MTVHHVSADIHLDPARHEDYLTLLEHAVFDTTVVPVRLLTDTRRGVGPALTQLLLFAGRAQPVITAQTRTTTRDEAYRIQVALTGSGHDLAIFTAEHLHPNDARLLAAIADTANVDLWLITHSWARDSLAAVLNELAGEHTWTLDAAIKRFSTRAGNNTRREASACEASLTLGAGPRPAPGCDLHADAAGCVLGTFAHALVTARTTPAAVRARLHQLTVELPTERAWSVFAVARDPYRFAVNASELLDITHAQYRRARLSGLALDGSTLTIGGDTVEVPASVRDVLAAHRDIRVAEGSPGTSQLFIPTDYAYRRNRRTVA